jgi:phage head maturation protease
MNRNITAYLPFTKTDDEARMVYGYCTSEALDSQGEIVKKGAIQKAWDHYMEYANVREMHQPSAVGVTKEYSHDDQGTWIGVYVADDRAWKFVKEGVYKGFSIGGRVTKKNKNIIESIVLAEISLVDRPANPDAKFSVVKVDGDLINRLELEATNEYAMKKYVEIEGVKYQEDPEKPGDALLDAEGEKVVFVEDVVKTPEEEVVPEVTPVPETVPEPEATPEPEAAPKDEKAEQITFRKGVNVPAIKDTMGVVTAASLLDNMAWVRSMFEMNGKDTTKFDGIIETLKSLIADEANEADKAAGSADLQKFSQSMGELFKAEIGPLLSKVDALQADVEKIKGTKVSPRPISKAAPVDKVIQNGSPESESVITQKRAEFEAIVKQIDENSVQMRATQDNGKLAAFAATAGELFTKRQSVQRELNDLIAGVN